MIKVRIESIHVYEDVHIYIPLLSDNAVCDLAAATGISGWTCSSGRPSTDPCSTWSGISCDDGVVRSFSLGTSGITGSIPNSIGLLSELTHLVFSTNNFFGTIPTTVGYLTNVVTFDLGNNRLSGSIPTQLVNLVYVTYLYLGQNKLTGTIPTGLGFMTGLAVFSFDTSSIYGSVPASLCQPHLSRIIATATSIVCYANCLSTVASKNFDASAYACTQGSVILWQLHSM